MPSHSPILLATTFAALLLGGCDGGGVALYVDLRTDIVPGAELAVVETRVEDTGATRESAALRGDDFLAGRRIAEIEGLPPSRERRVIVRLLDANRQEIARRAVQVDHRQDRILTVLVTRSCRDVDCPEGESCFAGQCQPEACATDRTECTGQCSSAMDCPPSSCSLVTCETGACFYAPQPGACGPGTYCDAERGCVVDPGAPPDAGMDAGPIADAGVDAGPPAPAFHISTIAPDAPEWVAFDTIDPPHEIVRAAFAPPGEGVIVALTDTSVHTLRLSDRRWTDRLDRDAVFPELAGVDVWEAYHVPGVSPLGVFVIAREGAWQYVWPPSAGRATLRVFTARADFGSDWDDPDAPPYWTVHGVYADPDNADGWVTTNPSSECPLESRVGRYGLFLSTDGFGPAVMYASVYDVDCLRFVQQGPYGEFPPFTLPGAPAPFSIEAIARADTLYAFTVP